MVGQNEDATSLRPRRSSVDGAQISPLTTIFRKTEEVSCEAAAYRISGIMASFSLSVLALLLALLLATEGVENTRATLSCLGRRLVQSGLSIKRASIHEKALLYSGATENELAMTPTSILAFLMKGSLAEASRLKQCIGGKTSRCKRPPCANGGACVVSEEKTQKMVCLCTKHYRGPYCKSPYPAPAHEVETLKQTVKLLQKKVAKIEKDGTSSTGMGKGCTRTDVGYAYKSWYALNDERENGKLVHMAFTKKRTDTMLRITWASNIRTYRTLGTGRWYIRIDGAECKVPQKLDEVMYQDHRNNIHTPGLLMGYCQATSKGAISRGSHTISVHIQRTRGSTDLYSGWDSTSTLEVREVCRPY